jgi:prevent-host-death family protein
MYMKYVKYGLPETAMTKLPASQVRKDFAEALNKVAYQHERIVLHRRGKDVAVLVPLEDLALLEALEDQHDIEAADQALADPKNKKRLRWDQAKVKLGQ